MSDEQNKGVNNSSKNGTPLDYSSDVYRTYIEVIDPTNEAKSILSNILGKSSTEILSLDYGYEFESPIQCIPDIVRELAVKNIAVYQVVRYSKTNKMWAHNKTVQWTP